MCEEDYTSKAIERKKLFKSSGVKYCETSKRSYTDIKLIIVVL